MTNISQDSLYVYICRANSKITVYTEQYHYSLCRASSKITIHMDNNENIDNNI